MSYKEFIKEGEFVILELKCGDVFEGIVINVGTNLCELFNTVQYNNPNKLQGVYTFYRSEIKNIFKMLMKNNKNITVNQSHSHQCKISELNIEEFNKLKLLSESYIYLEKSDHRYFKAIHDLENTETIGIVPLGLDNSLSTDIKLLGICTHQQVYLFDMADLKERYFYPELKLIFESKFINKVLHGGMAFVEVLNKMYNVYTTNIFDTQLSDLFIEKLSPISKSPKVAKTLAQCIGIYLTLPQSILKIPERRTRVHWSERPLNNEDKLYASQLCVYLLKLHQKITQLLLKPTNESIHVFHNGVYDSSECDFTDYGINNKVTQSLNNIISNQAKSKDPTT